MHDLTRRRHLCPGCGYAHDPADLCLDALFPPTPAQRERVRSHRRPGQRWRDVLAVAVVLALLCTVVVAAVAMWADGAR